MIRSALLLAALASALVWPVAAAPAEVRPAPSPTPKPTKVVARSERLVTARTSDGGTLSYNCKKPENRKRKVCRS